MSAPARLDVELEPTLVSAVESDRATPMNCPTCHVDMQHLDLGAYGLVAVHRCPTCAGTWLPPEQLALLGDEVWKHSAPARAHAVDGDGGVACPGCGKSLEATSPADVRQMVVGKCPSCQGCWIGRRVLDHIAALGDDEDSKIIVRNKVDGRPAHWSMLRWIGWRLRRCFE